MCGRFTLTKPADVIADYFELHDFPDWQPRFNIAPTQAVPTVSYDQQHQQRKFKRRHWGLIPSWSRDDSFAARMINARAETACEKPAFRESMQHRRCLVMTDGFYEWQAPPVKGQLKQPFYIRMLDGALFAMAGLWAQWQRADGEIIQSCTVLTTRPNEMMKCLHHRMPVIIAPQAYEHWLDPSVTDPGVFEALLRPYPSEGMHAEAVSTKVNSSKYDAPDCVNPVAKN